MGGGHEVERLVLPHVGVGSETERKRRVCREHDVQRPGPPCLARLLGPNALWAEGFECRGSKGVPMETHEGRTTTEGKEKKHNACAYWVGRWLGQSFFRYSLQNTPARSACALSFALFCYNSYSFWLI